MSNERILIVDDIEENLLVLTETLKAQGWSTLQAKSGERAIEIAQKALPDLILMDIKMPGMDGYETLTKMKSIADLKDIPVIFISALNQIEDKVKGFQIGAVDYVSKPFQKEEVIARVSTHLRLRAALTEVEKEKSRSEAILKSVLPNSVAQELKDFGVFTPKLHKDASLLFSDIVGFTDASAKLSPRDLIDDLDELFSSFDKIIAEHDCERIKTIGDAYLASCGVPDEKTDHAFKLVSAAKAMIDWLEQKNKNSIRSWQIRVGIHSGTAVSGIVGTSRFLYDVFGDTVNTASRMESHSEPMRINISSDTALLLKNRFPLTAREAVSVKGKGDMNMFFVD